MAMTGKGLNFRLKATDQTRSAFNSVQNNIRTTKALQGSWNKGLNANRRAVQQFGFQMTDFATQIAGGQDAMLAFTQQGGQMLQFFGPFGAISAALLAVFGSMFIAMSKTGTALSEITPIMGVLEDEFTAMIGVLADVGGWFIDFANVVVNNLDRIIITAGLLLGFFVGKWILGMIAARLAVMTLAGSLLFLRGALIRTGFGALIVGAGELVFWFTKLVGAAGGFGNAMGMLRDVVAEVFKRMGFRSTALSKKLAAVAVYIASVFIDAFAKIAVKWDDMVNGMAVPFNDLMASMGLSARMGQSSIGDSLDLTAKALERQAFRLQLNGEAWAKMARQPLTSLAALRDAMAKADKEGKDIDIRDWFGGSGGSGSGGGGGGMVDEMTSQAKKIKAVFDDMSKSIKGSLSSAFGSLLDRTKSISDIIQDLLIGILNKVATAALDPVWAKIGEGITASLIGNPPSSGGGGGGGLLSKVFASLLSFDGGGSTGNGARSGGLDGKGGMLAMVHPRETVTDHTKGGSGGSGGGTSLEVHIHENASASGGTEVKQSGNRVDVFLRRAVNDIIGSGGADQGMGARFGAKPQAMGR